MNKQHGSSPKYSLQLWLEAQPWFEPLHRAFWSNSDRLMAAKATVSIALLAVPLVLAGQSFFAVTLALGALAGALSETDDHPRGRIKSLILKVISFGISSLAVELLRPWPVILGLGLAVSTIVFLLIGGLGERYRGVTFGALLVGLYTMLGTEISHQWYWQPILLSGGALFYGIISLALLYYRPWRLLEEQLARGFQALSAYMEEKANLFPSDEKRQGEIRNRLALLNVELVGALDRCKEVLNSYGDALKDETPLKPYLHYFMLLQGLHERAASSHERYDLLSRDSVNQALLEGIGQLLHQLAGATHLFAASLLSGKSYRHPVSLNWSVKALNDQLEKYQPDGTHPLALLVKNLSGSNAALQQANNRQQQSPTPRLAKDKRSLAQRFKDQLNPNHPRLRHAIRLSICFLIGFAISEGLDVSKGEWIILTSLFVCQPSYSETRRRLFQRMLGTLTGVIAGVLVVQLLPTVPGQLLLMLAAAFAFFVWLRRNYSVSVIFITIFVLAAFNLIAGKGVAVMLPRLLDTFIGSALAFITVRFLWPDWQHKRMPGLLAEALDKNAAYFRAIIQEYRRPASDDDLDYRIARREAHRADNALVLAWQDMQVEPRKRRQFREQAFTLTYLNHALLSYLSAFGAHREQESGKNDEIPEIAGQLLEILQDCAQVRPKEGTRQAVENVLSAIGQKTAVPNVGILRQQLNLLYHIAEVSLKIIERSELFQAKNEQA